MASRIIFSNLSRNDDYTILINGQASVTVLPLKTNAIDLEPGEYELNVEGSNEEGLPTICKPIQVTMEDRKTVHLQVIAHHFAIGIYDDKGTQLNARHGFLCGSVADGVYIDNPIT
ncbi:MAG: hypothetical protein CSYNP_00141 [Syntrophus sp. SKADARSKE-3]|nr:hypothetical protein [Syntrophus sp. SKADARSKE-3]